MLEKERDIFTKDLVEIGNEYVKNIQEIWFELALPLHNGFCNPDELDVEALLAEAGKKLAQAQKEMEIKTAILIRLNIPF